MAFADSHLVAAQRLPSFAQPGHAPSLLKDETPGQPPDIHISTHSARTKDTTMHTIQEITPFEVPAGKDEEFLQGWNEVAGQVRQAAGVLSTRLHESLDPQTKFRYVAVTEWESSLLYEAARNQINKLFEELRRAMPFAAYPGSYRTIVSAVVTSHSYEMFFR
jgi:heme-degrading monooxygenase HmoA